MFICSIIFEILLIYLQLMQILHLGDFQPYLLHISRGNYDEKDGTCFVFYNYKWNLSNNTSINAGLTKRHNNSYEYVCM